MAFFVRLVDCVSLGVYNEKESLFKSIKDDDLIKEQEVKIGKIRGFFGSKRRLGSQY